MKAAGVMAFGADESAMRPSQRRTDEALLERIVADEGSPGMKRSRASVWPSTAVHVPPSAFGSGAPAGIPAASTIAATASPETNRA